MTVSWKQLIAHCELDKVEALIELAERFGAQAITQENASEDSYYDLAAPSSPQWQQQCVTALFEQKPLTDELLLSMQASVPGVSAVRLMY